MTYEFIKCEVTGNGVAKVLLNRPEKLNALSLPLQAELYECLQAADDDPAVRVITLRGAGRAFCAGYDVTPPQTDDDRRASEERRGNIRQDMHRLRKTARLMTSVFDLSKPVIAGIHGHVIAGGTDLALHCDMVIAADDANIGFPPRSFHGDASNPYVDLYGRSSMGKVVYAHWRDCFWKGSAGNGVGA